MTQLLKKLSSAVMIVLGVGLLLSCVLWLIGNTGAPTEERLRFLPVRHETVFLRLGSFELELSPRGLAFVGLSGSVVLVVIGALLWRTRSSGTARKNQVM